MLAYGAIVANRHPRQAAVLLQVPVPARSAVMGRAGLICNTRPGYIFSQALDLARQDLERLGGDVEALQDLDRAENHAAMRSCGCAACSRDAARLSS